MRDRNIIDEGAKAGRQACIIVGCGRTFKDEGHNAQICGKHWRLADKRLQRVMRRLEAAARRLGWNDARLDMHHRGFWHIVQQAQERSMGL